MGFDDFWKKKTNDVAKEQERIAKEQERKDFELISKAENLLLKKYENIQKFDKAIKRIKGGIKLNSTWRPLYLKILNDLNNHNPRLISLNGVKDQILQTTKYFKITHIPSGTDIRHVELRRINLRVNRVIGELLVEGKVSDVIQNDKKRRKEVISGAAGVLKAAREKGEEIVSDYNQKRIENKKERKKKNIEEAINNYNSKKEINGLKKYFPNNFSDLAHYLDTFSSKGEVGQAFIKTIIERRAESNNVDIEKIFKGITGKEEVSNATQQVVHELDSALASTTATFVNTDIQASGKKPEEGEERHSNSGKEKKRLNERDISLREFLTSWSEQDTEVGSEGLTLKQAFLIQNKEWLRSLRVLTDKELKNKYNEREKNRLNNIKQVLNYDDLLAYATRKQIKIANFDGTTTQNFSEWIKNHPNINNNEDKESQSIMKFLGFTQGELIGELLKNVDINSKEGLRLLQVLSLSTAKGTRLFDDEHLTGDWNAETQYFLESALKDPTFQESDTTGEYANKIREVLNSHPHLDTSYLEQDFQTLSEVQNREQEFFKNPDAIWQSQTLEGSREFVGISDLGYGNSYKLGEQEFLNSHMQGFNGKLAEFLNIPQFKEGVPIDETSRTRMEQIWNTIPLEEINGIYTQFASNPEEQKKFQDFLNENNLQNIDINDISLKNLVLNQNLSFNPVAKYCYDRIWISYQNEILSESGKTLQYLSDKTGDTALNIKNKVLEFFLPGISIHPEKAENGIFYFRDENNLDTLYSFNPENGEISQQGNISMEEEGIISLKSGGAKGNLLQKIQGFQNIVDFDLLDVLPNQNPKNMEELENEILNRIQSKITVDNVADTSVVSKNLLRTKNERNVCQNRIVGDLKQLLNVEDDYLYETDGENHRIFYGLLKTFEKINIENPNDNKPLISMKLLLDKICNSTGGFKLLKPSLLENNGDGDTAEEIPQENTNGEIQNPQQTARESQIVKNLIDPNTQLFDINLVNNLANNSEVDRYLSEGKLDRVLGEIQKNRELKIAEEEYEKEVAKLYNNTRDELHGLNEDVELFANISSLENEGEFLS